MGSDEDATDRYLDAVGKAARKICGKPYKVKRAGREWTKYCTKRKGHWGRHG